jgi:hypothetical protein
MYDSQPIINNILDGILALSDAESANDIMKSLSKMANMMPPDTTLEKLKNLIDKIDKNNN